MYCEYVERLRLRFVKKIQYWIPKSERIRKRILRFFTKQINPGGSIQDISDHGASKKSKNPLPEWIFSARLAATVEELMVKS